MILTSLVLENIGSFYGRHEIELKPTDSNRPIVLIGALNGSGKTTILESLQLGLYGRRAKSLFRIKTGYDDYLKKIVSRKATQSELASIELLFANEEVGSTVNYRLHRSWSFHAKQPVETIKVYVDGRLDPVLSDTWDEQVERLIPRNLSHLFFFDGERIETLADPSQSADILRTGIYSLLGLELVDQLHADLSVYRRRLKKSIASPRDAGEISRFEEELATKQEKKSALLDQLARVNKDLDAEKRQLRAVRDSFEKHGGKVYESRSALEKERVEIRTTIGQIDESLRVLCAHNLPLCVVESQIQDLVGTLRGERRAVEAKELLTNLETRDDLLLKWLRRLPAATSDLQDEVGRYLAQDRDALLESANFEIKIGASDEAFALLTSAIESSIGKEYHQANELVEKRKEHSARLDFIERSLERLPDESVIRSYVEDRANAEARCSQLKKDRARLEGELRAARFEATQIEQELEKRLSNVRQLEIDSEDAQRLADYSARVQHTLDELRQNTLAGHLVSLESRISEAFRRLLRKDSLIENVHIDPDTFNVTLSAADGHEIAPQLISAGERQILAIALLWGLGQAAGRKIPIVIDTPLGRLDSVHRKQLVDEYFPEASHQVVLLSTDEEIDEELSEDLAESIAHHYTLHYDDKTEFTSVKRGYFWH